MKDQLNGWKLQGRGGLLDALVSMHDSGFVEAICPHGTGHHRGVHGCDGCCGLPEAKEIMLKTTKE